jgi:putative tryptophan/tyrosine transport system substrate-binding protein
MSLKITRRTAVGLLGGALATNSVPARAQNRMAFSNWFKYGSELDRSWSVSEVDGDANRVLIRPLGMEINSGKRITVLYPRASSAYDTAITKILDVFDDKNMAVWIDVVNYAGSNERAAAAVAEAEERKCDLIVTMGSESTALLWQTYKGGRIPVVTVCAKDPVTLAQMPSYDVGSGTNFAFTSLNMPIDAQMGYVHQLRPNLKHLAVLVDDTNVSAVETQAKPVSEYGAARGIRVLQLGVKDPRHAKEELTDLVRRAVAFMQRTDPDLQNSVFWITGSTSVFNEIATINKESGSAPVLSVVPEVVTEGDNSAVLSIGVSFESNAHLAAIYAADVLDRKTEAGALKVGLVSPPDIAINFRRAKAIGFKVPFNFFESATNIYDYDGRAVRINGVMLAKKK